MESSGWPGLITVALCVLVPLVTVAAGVLIAYAVAKRGPKEGRDLNAAHTALN